MRDKFRDPGLQGQKIRHNLRVSFFSSLVAFNLLLLAITFASGWVSI